VRHSFGWETEECEALLGLSRAGKSRTPRLGVRSRDLIGPVGQERATETRSIASSGSPW
jgi:hypothetical protein